MSGPLSGIKIVDLTTVISGPSATMLLADQGADIIKVESISAPDHARGAGVSTHQFTSVFLNNNRNKKALALDLKDPRGKAALLAVCRDADVVIQNFRPGVVERLGVGEDDIRPLNPEVIYVSISGFGETGPLAHKPVYDPIIQAVSGLATIQAGSDELRPRLIRTILPDKLTGVVTAQAVTSALFHKLKTGKGQHVRVSMLDAVVNFLWSSDMGGQTFVGQNISQQRAATFIDLIYETKTGYISVSAMANKQWLALCDAVGHPEWKEDARFNTPTLRDLNANERLEMTQEALLSRSAEEWLDLLETAGVPCAPVLTRNQMVEHPQILANDLLFLSEHPVAGEIRQARPAARFSATPSEQRLPAPKHGEHTREILRAAGMTIDEVDDLLAAGAVYASD